MNAQPQEAPESAPGLSPRDIGILNFERVWVRHSGAKEEAIRAEFALSTARYYQLLNAAIDMPAAERYDPVLVRGLRRVREARSRARLAKAFKISVTDHESID